MNGHDERAAGWNLAVRLIPGPIEPVLDDFGVQPETRVAVPGVDPAPFPFAPFDELLLGGLSEELPPFSDLWAAGEGTFLAVFSSSFSFLEGDLCTGLSLGLDFGVLLSSGVGFAAGLALGLGVGLGVDLGVGFTLGFDVAEGLGFGDGVGFGVGFGVIKFGGGVGVT